MSTKDALNQARKTINVLHEHLLKRCSDEGHRIIGGRCKWCLTDEKNIGKKVN